MHACNLLNEQYLRIRADPARLCELGEAAMTMMAYSLTAEERSEVRNAFLEIDKDLNDTAA